MSITNRPLPENTAEFEFEGIVTFSRERKDGLRRTVRVLHAVIAGYDHSDGTLHSWRNSRRKPLDDAVAQFLLLHRAYDPTEVPNTRERFEQRKWRRLLAGFGVKAAGLESQRGRRGRCGIAFHCRDGRMVGN